MIRDLVYRGLKARPLTETVDVGSGMTLINGTITGGASVFAVLSDESDSSYATSAVYAAGGGAQHTLQSYPGTLSPLQYAYGRGISSFRFLYRASTTSLNSSPTGSPYIRIGNGYNLSGSDAPSPSTPQFTFTLANVIQVGALGPLTRSGGGSWTEAQISGLNYEVLCSSNTPDSVSVYQLRCEVTYDAP